MELRDLTPKELKCHPPKCTCPALFESDRNSFVVIGKRLKPEERDMLANRIAEDEYVIEIPKELLAQLMSK